MREWTFGLALAALAATAAPVLAADADAIYFGGTILTIDKKAPTAGAVAVKGGLITAVGDQEAVTAAEKGADTEMVDLRGKTLIPGFVDAHSHMAGVGLQAVSANLLPPPDGPVTSIADLQKAMREFIATSPKPKAYGVAIGLNYDDSQLAEKRHPTREELDAVSTDIPIVIVHQSGHLAVMNTKALEKAGITADTPNPPGGVIRREADGKTPNGVLEEMAHLANTPKLLPKFTPAQAMELVEAAQNIYVANGFTTAQEGRASPGLIAMLRGAAAAQALVIDVVAYADLAASSDHLEGADSFEDTVDMSEAPQPGVAQPSNDPTKIVVSRDYVDHFRVGGVKLTFDGSPQGKTAWFTKPYYVPPEGQKADYVGYPAFPKPGEAQSWVDMAYRNNWQVMIHANGDAAIDEVIKTVGQAQKTYGGGDRRTVLIHGQYLRADQIPELKKLGIIPALYPMHTFYWGDWHRQSVAGPQRAAFISPTGAVLAAGMIFTIHSDAPVTFPNSMRILDSAVNRTTRSGFVLGPDQRIAPAVALEAMTLWPAYQHFEDKTKGSLEVGKAADLVILSDNPLAVPPAKIKDIKVIETIKAGKTVYLAPPPAQPASPPPPST
jgi:predicted amidohydrolase YtcJ